MRVFGAGVAFRRASVELTKGAVTRTIDKELPQLMRTLRERAARGEPITFIGGSGFHPELYYFSRGDGP